MEWSSDAKRLKRMTIGEQYEILAAAYYKRFGQMAPGKDPGSVPGELSQRENFDRWMEWLKSDEAKAALSSENDWIREEYGNGEDVFARDKHGFWWKLDEHNQWWAIGPGNPPGYKPHS